MSVIRALQAISESTRFEILRLLHAHKELPAGKIAEHFPVTRAAISQHLTVLKAGKLIAERREGTKRLYRLRQEGFTSLLQALKEFSDLAQPGVPDNPFTHRDTEPEPSKESVEQVTRQPENVAEPEPITEPAAEPTVKGDQQVEAEIVVAAKAARIYPLLTHSRGLSIWLAEQATVEAVPGGRFQVSDGAGVVIGGQFVNLEENRQVEFTWGGVEGMAEGASSVGFRLEEGEEGTRVFLCHRDLPDRLAPTYLNIWTYSALPKLRDAAEGRWPDSVALAAPE